MKGLLCSPNHSISTKLISRSQAADIDKHLCVYPYRDRSYPWAFFLGGGVQKVLYFHCFGIEKHHINVEWCPYMSLFHTESFNERVPHFK